MSDGVIIEQKAGIGSEVTQIGTQINNNGLTPYEACQLATEMFYQNFPKLQEQAMAAVNSRIDELMKSLVAKLDEKNIQNLTPLKDPDLQYVIFEAQKSYARFEKKEMLATLTDLIATRVKNNDNNICLKVAIDKAIETVGLLNKEHLDLLAALFVVTKVHFGSIQCLDDLAYFLHEIDCTFPNVEITTYPHLIMLGCLQIELSDIPKILSRSYNVSVQQVKDICPANILKLTGDYNTTNIGTMLAITHLENCTDYRFNPEIWIR